MINFGGILFAVLKTIWPLLLIVAVIGIAAAVVAIVTRKRGDDPMAEELPFEKKPFVFDALSELNLYRMLTEICGDRYYVFPQVGYGKLIQIKKGADKRNRNYFDKKSADFVLCDKGRAVAQLVIELDGRSHLSERKIARDEKIDMWMKSIGLPILHLNPAQLDRARIQEQISNILSGEKS